MVSFREFVPPVALPMLRRVKRLAMPAPPPPKLFDGDGELFQRVAAGATVYLEYGMGLSTQWVLSNTSAIVHAVDTSREWVENTISAAPHSTRSRLNARWVDLGPVKMWGYPVSYRHHRRFHEYVQSLWDSHVSPDLVLVDGRFRVCCFLHSMLTAKPGTKIFFDDYVHRPQYHVVEEFARPVEVCGRQSMFVVPPDLDRGAIRAARDQFLYVMD